MVREVEVGDEEGKETEYQEQAGGEKQLHGGGSLSLLDRSHPN